MFMWCAILCNYKLWTLYIRRSLSHPSHTHLTFHMHACMYVQREPPILRLRRKNHINHTICIWKTDIYCIKWRTLHTASKLKPMRNIIISCMWPDKHDKLIEIIILFFFFISFIHTQHILHDGSRCFNMHIFSVAWAMNTQKKLKLSSSLILIRFFFILLLNEQITLSYCFKSSTFTWIKAR